MKTGTFTNKNQDLPLFKKHFLANFNWLQLSSKEKVLGRFSTEDIINKLNEASEAEQYEDEEERLFFESEEREEKEREKKEREKKERNKESSS